MTITAQRLLTELGDRAWSGFNRDDMFWSNDESYQAKAELNSALRYLINLEDFPFKAKSKTIQTSANNPSYSYPSGQLASIINVDTKGYLTFIGGGDDKDLAATGEPTSYWVEYKNPARKIRLYPMPDAIYNLRITYNTFMPVMTANNILQMEFTSEDDFLNLPADLEYLFMDCLVLRTMIQNNKDEQDENYRPTIDEFNDYWKLFKRACNSAKSDTRIVW